eukprot:m.223845 g.223845  ORF g.223845 m.223845 type:complete len:159 (-) comp15142_c0_seq2:1809-2285(-)
MPRGKGKQADGDANASKDKQPPQDREQEQSGGEGSCQEQSGAESGDEELVEQVSTAKRSRKRAKKKRAKNLPPQPPGPELSSDFDAPPFVWSSEDSDKDDIPIYESGHSDKMDECWNMAVMEIPENATVDVLTYCLGVFEDRCRHNDVLPWANKKHPF